MGINYVIESVVSLYEGYMWTLTFADKRVENWMFMSSPKYTFYLTLLYLICVAVLPLLTRSLPPMDLRPLLVIFNGCMALFNAYIMIEIFYVSIKAGYSYRCQPVAHTYNVWEYRMACVLWWFYVSKLVEFFDTLFFILRKKYKQLTFLHVYHHSTMFCFWWIGIKWVAGGSSFLGALMNSFVHVIMYTYYGMTAAFPQKNFWWKKYLTLLQLVQFCFAIFQTVIGLYIDCPFPRWMGYTMIAYMISFIILFSNFWRHAYQYTYKSKRKLSVETNGIIDNGNSENSEKFKENVSTTSNYPRRSIRLRSNQ